MKQKTKFSFRFSFSELLLVLLLVVSGLMLGFSSKSFVLNFKKIGFSIFTSVEKGVVTVTRGVRNTFNSAKELRQLKRDYDDLVEKLENYEQMQRSNADIRKENERLKDQLGFSIYMEEKNIPCQIISRDLDNLYSYLTINKGSVNGIRKNMPVVAFQNGSQGLVGKVVEVGTFTSQVMPIYNLNCIVSSRIQNTREIGLVSGNGDPSSPLSMQYIRKRTIDSLHYGDIIVTSGENDNYMRDIPVGSISKITSIDYNSSLDIELSPIIDFSRLEVVFVVNMKELNDKKESAESEGSNG
ncbi:MAG: rod shape-determining protein MreC [Treponema sp.]|nr:rod shape-determining protein MreC [Treponema sp.]